MGCDALPPRASIPLTPQRWRLRGRGEVLGEFCLISPRFWFPFPAFGENGGTESSEPSLGSRRCVDL